MLGWLSWNLAVVLTTSPMLGDDPVSLASPGSEVDARKALPGYFEVYEVEVRVGDLGGLPGVIGWLGKARN